MGVNINVNQIDCCNNRYLGHMVRTVRIPLSMYLSIPSPWNRGKGFVSNQNGEKMENKIKAERKPIRYIFRATKTVNGVKYYAKDYGKKCFVIPIYE